MIQTEDATLQPVLPLLCNPGLEPGSIINFAKEHLHPCTSGRQHGALCKAYKSPNKKVGDNVTDLFKILKERNA